MAKKRPFGHGFKDTSETNQSACVEISNEKHNTDTGEHEIIIIIIIIIIMIMIII